MQRHLEKTIEFNKQEEALAILGYNDEYLKILSDSFDSKIISRGDKVVVRGNNNEVLSIEKVLMELLNLYRNTGELTSHDVKYCIELIKKGEQELLNKVFNNVVLVTAKGKQVKPKTVGQSIYLEAIKKKAILDYKNYGIKLENEYKNNIIRRIFLIVIEAIMIAIVIALKYSLLGVQ